MPMPKREPLRRTVPLLLFGMLLSVVAGLAACEPYQVSDRSVNFNDALQDFDNRQVLLNAVRASKRYPPYYTAVNQITSVGELDGSQVNFSLPFGPVSHNVDSVSPMIKVGTGITLQTNPLDTQDFYEGYMQQVKIDLIGNYLDYGWPTQLIVHTFLREIDLPQAVVEGIKVRLRQVLAPGVVPACMSQGPGGFAGCLDNLPDEKLIADNASCPSLHDLNVLTPEETGSFDGAYEYAATRGGVIVRFVNSPGHTCSFATFQLLTAMLEKLQLVAVSVPPPSTAAKPISVPTSQTGMSIKIENDADSSGAAKVNFGLNKVTDPCLLAKGTPPAPAAAAAGADTAVAHPMPLPAKGQPLPAEAAEAVAAAAKPAAHPAPAAAHPAPAPVPHANPAAVKTNPATALQGAWETLCKDETLIKVVPRSPEAIVFYLGQLIEAEYPEKGTPFVAKVHGLTPGPDGAYPLFDVQKDGAGQGGAEVSVSLDGDTYYIPRGDNFRSTMHMLTLAEQVIGLQKKGTQAPGLVPVQVINP
jgi:hypothetical protein